MITPARTTAVDLIRLCALVGIGVVNVVFLGLPTETVLAPAETPSGQAAAFVVAAFFESKFFVLFSFLFGWGIYVQDRSARAAGVSFAGRYARRVIGLGVLGGLHAVLVFTGDILLLYALLALLIWPFHGLSPRNLMRIGYAMIPLALVMLLVLGLVIPEQIEPVAGPGRGGSFMDATRARLAEWPMTLGFILLFQGPLAFGAFAMGLAAGKAGFFGADSPGRARLRRRVRWFLPVGLSLNVAYAVSAGGVLGPGQGALALAGYLSIALGGPMLAAVYLHLILVLDDRVKLPRVLAAAGQNSLSVYVLQGVIAGGVFGGYGLGLFNQIALAWLVPLGGLIAVLAIVVVGFVAMKAGRGPLEALLRAVTYGRAQRRGRAG